MSFHDARRAVALAADRRVFYGWVMVAVAMAGFFASGPGQSHLFSVFIGPVAADLDMSRTAVSSAYAGATLAAAFGLPWVGRLVDRHGVRRVALAVTVLFGLAAFAFGRVSGVVALALGFAALRFLGQGSMMLVFSNLVAQWFGRRRGFALSLVSYGFALSMALHPPLAQWLIAETGWRTAWVWLGLLTWVALLPLVVLLIQDRPEDVGLRPDGDGPPPDAGKERPLRGSMHEGLTLRAAVRTPAFWILAAGLGTLSMTITGMFFHQVSVLETQGVPVRTAASVFSVSAVSMVAFVPVIGRLLDRFPPRRVFAAGLVTMSAATVSMAFATDLPTVLVYGVVFGIANAVMHAHLAFLWAHFFGRRHLGSIQGAGQTINTLSASLGPLPLGTAFDLTGGYRVALLGLAPLPLLCAVAVLAMPAPDLERAG